MGNLFLIHSDPIVQNDWRTLLENDGHWVLTAATVPFACHRIPSHKPDLILLEASMPPDSTSENIQKLQALLLEDTVPIVLLVRNAEISMFLNAFPAMSSKECLSVENQNPDTLTNIIQPLLGHKQIRRNKKRLLCYGHMELDRQKRSARFGNHVVSGIPKKLFELVWLLSKRSKDVSSRQLIIEKIWHKQVRDREVDVIVSRLKSRLPFIAPFVETTHGKGYRLLPPTLSHMTSK